MKTFLSFLFGITAVMFVGPSCDSTSSADDKMTACEVSCAKACSCGTNVCGSGPNGANNGCIRSCAGLEGSPPSSDAFTDCMANASCAQVLAGQCQALNQ